MTDVLQIPLIPRPRKLDLQSGVLDIKALINISINLEAEKLANWGKTLGRLLHRHGINATFTLHSLPDAIPEVASQASEAYQLQVSPPGICITATADGTSNALQTVVQLLWWAEKEHSQLLPCLEISDWPQYPWRGLHLDVSRHFFDATDICQYLDEMALLKLNKFHWHLTDDQGWRIESLVYPRLSSISAWRREADGSMYGGCYTRQEIRRVIAHANSLGIEVIPEIDLPGHSMALLAAYPELACFPSDFSPLSCWGISEDILCAGKDATLEFLEMLFNELAELFPGKYFHLGGDEAPKTKWQQCPHCQMRIRKLGLNNEEELQGWLINKLAKHLQQLGKTVIGWDEILDGKIGTEPIVMAWRGDGHAAARAAASNGNRYILCPNRCTYFDWHQKAGENEPGAFGVTTLEQVYHFDPAAYKYGVNHLLLGAQANVWTEHMESFDRVSYMVFPRAWALAEVLWSDPRAQNYDEFCKRLSTTGAML